MAKGKFISAVIATAFGVSGIALALTPATDPVDYEWRLAGASGLDSSIRDIVTFQLCVPGTIDVFVEEQSGHWEVHCEVGAAVPSAAGDRVLFRKSNSGSGDGVVGVDDGATTLPYLTVSTATDLASLTTICPTTAPLLDPDGAEVGTEWSDCSATAVTQEAGDFAVSAIEPQAFVGTLSPLAGGFGGSVTPFADGSGMIVSPIAGIGVGIVTTLNFYEELQHSQFPAGKPNFAQCNPDGSDYSNPATDSKGAAFVPSGHIEGLTEKCMPKLSKSFVTNLLNGTYATIFDIPTGDPSGPGPTANTLGGNAIAAGRAPSSQTLRLCRRVQGSGVHAQTAKFFLRSECGRASQVMVGGCDGASGANCGQVVENQSADEMSDCLNAAEAANTWAVGYQSVEENADLSHAFNWVKIDGMAPTLENQLSGRYDNIGEASLQRRGTPTGAAASTASGYVGAPVAGQDTKVVAIYNAIVSRMSGPAAAEAMNNSDRFRMPFGNTGWGARVDVAGGVEPFPQFFDPVTGEFDLPVNAGTHVNPLTLTQDSCFGPVHPAGVQLNQ